jgi:predicted nucleotidyltransferase
MSIIDLIVEQRKNILETCFKYGATNVRIFGSCARTDYDDKSDIDILVNMPQDLKGFNYINRLCDLEDQLKQLLHTEVDVIDEVVMKGKKRERILKEAISL